MIGWLLSTRLGHALSGATVALLAILTFGAVSKRKGRQEGREEVRRRAEAAAEARKETRDEIDEDIRSNGADDARDSLRADWGD